MVVELGTVEVETLRGLVLASEGEGAHPVDPLVDWPRLLASARRHRLEPLLLRGATDSIPHDVRRKLDDAWNRSLARTVVQLHHLDELAAHAVGREIDVCLLKGAALATSIYRHPALRPMADLDLLVGPGYFERSGAMLEEIGYERKDVSDHAVAFAHGRTGVLVELHRSLTSCERLLGVSVEELLARSRPAPGFDSPRVRALALQDQLLHLCLHASFQHGFRQAGVNAWDQRLLAEREELDEDAFVERARRPSLARWVYGGLRLAEAVFPSDGLARLRHRLEGHVPRRLSRRALRLTANRLLSPSPAAVFGPPWARFAWAGGPVKTLFLLAEISRPRSGDGAMRPVPLFRRFLQLASTQSVAVLRSALGRNATTLLGSTSASLGEVRDV